MFAFECAGDIPFLQTIDDLNLVDHFAILTDCKVGLDVGNLLLFTSPLNEQYAVGDGTPSGSSAFDWFYTINYALSNWFYPADGGVLVMAAQQTTKHDLGKTLYINMGLFPRYKWFRV